MIKIIDRTNAAEFSDILEQQFANRHEVFVKELGWLDFDTGIALEKDSYDNEHAIYAISLDGDGKAIGGMRFYPTTLPHMLSETFPDLVDGPVISRPDVYEATRFHLLRPYRKTPAHIELLTAIQEVGLHLGAAGMSSIVRTLRLPILLETGISIVPIGEPQMVDGVSNLAVYYEVNERVLARMNKRRGSSRPVLDLPYQAAKTA